MKTLATLLLVTSLASCAIPTPEQRAELKSHQLAQAEASCAVRHMAGPQYYQCLDAFVRLNYGMTIKRSGDGQLALVNAEAALPLDLDHIPATATQVPDLD